MRTLKAMSVKAVTGGLERIVKGLSNQRGNAAVGVGAILIMFGIMGLAAYVCTPTAPRIPNVQPYANGGTVQGVVLAEQSGTADGSYFGVPGTTAYGQEILIRAPDGKCYAFGTADTSAPQAGGTSTVSELEQKVEVGTEVVVKGFDPAYKGEKDCSGTRYFQPVAPSQIEVVR